MTTQRAKPRVIVWPDGQASGRVDVSAFVTAFHASERIDEAVGTWSVTLKATQPNGVLSHIARLPDLYHRSRPNGLVSLGFDEAGGILLGLIDNVRRVRRRRGQASASITLSGSTIGKTIARDNIVRAVITAGDYPRWVAKIQSQLGPDHTLIRDLLGPWGPTTGRDGARVFDIRTKLSDVVDWVLDTVASMQVPLLKSQGGTGRPGDFLTSFVTTWNDGRVVSDEAKDYEGTIEAFIRSLLDQDVYDFFVTCYPPSQVPGLSHEIPQPCLFIRPKPFDEPGLMFLPTVERPGIDWNSLRTMVQGLPYHEIGEDDVWEEDLGFTDHDVFGYYSVCAQRELLGNDECFRQGLFYPAVDLFAITRTGLRAYRANCSLVNGDTDAQSNGTPGTQQAYVEQVIETRNRLINWYRLNEYMEAGSITVRGKDSYRIGDPVFLSYLYPARGGPAPDKGVKFYTIGTDWTWAVGEPYTTRLSITRGHNQSVITQAQAEILAATPPEAMPADLATIDFGGASADTRLDGNASNRGIV